jgi:hypothetical protein
MNVRGLTGVAALALALVACGSEDDSEAEQAFGGLTDRDVELADNVTAEVRRFSDGYTDFLAALNKLEVDEAHAAVDSMEEHIDKAIDIAAGVENTQWRSTYGDYLATMEDVTTAAERVVDYLEGPGTPKPKLEDKLAARLQAAAEAAAKADRALLERVTEHASPEERERLEQEYEDARRRFEQQTGQ